jgi:hypothetical protein
MGKEGKGRRKMREVQGKEEEAESDSAERRSTKKYNYELKMCELYNYINVTNKHVFKTAN